jgi:sec-independent protein translocase protein TatB
LFDVGFQEVVLIGVIALLVIGPERLPTVARSVGRWVGKMQRFVAGVKRDLQSELNTDEVRKLLNSQEDQIRELKEMVNETRSDFEKTARSASSDISSGMDQAVEQVRDAASTVKKNNDDVAAAINDTSDNPKTGSA